MQLQKVSSRKDGGFLAARERSGHVFSLFLSIAGLRYLSLATEHEADRATRLFFVMIITNIIISAGFTMTIARLPTIAGPGKDRYIVHFKAFRGGTIVGLYR